jgi:hypothetical protein
MQIFFGVTETREPTVQNTGVSSVPEPSSPTVFFKDIFALRFDLIGHKDYTELLGRSMFEYQILHRFS